MAREFTEGFYGKIAWRRLASLYKKKVKFCERCMRNGELVPGEIVHHRIHLSPENYKDVNVALNEANLELLCRKCHALEHSKGGRGRYIVDENGDLFIRE